ncbi:hypothetical protein EHF33_20790 (plasmid) [Deinococcus psychrotolerans]|uniref:Uncharacterized protein n=1 Tax=Deinococcus psychrotolerans TaxID=2489213 RepID=A0A3G8YKZ8_9DEIO|nr:hypothetical protein [Deinococcus psychrotolerans]AZI45350.1 hypothetical protein EHF33_20790 [Deinococcus psychrotolerans]
MKSSLLLLGTLLLSQPSPSPPVFCEVRILRDYDVSLTYFAVFRLASSCPAGGVARVRKSSTMNTKAAGARYQPIRPLVGAWEVSADGTTIPFSSRWTLNSWQWQYWDGDEWKPMKSARRLPSGERP